MTDTHAQLKLSGVLLPIAPIFYGEITSEELELFLSLARRSLEEFGLKLRQTVGPQHSDSEKELWATKGVTLDGQVIVSQQEGVSCGLDIDWPALVGCSGNEITAAIDEASTATYDRLIGELISEANAYTGDNVYQDVFYQHSLVDIEATAEAAQGIIILLCGSEIHWDENVKRWYPLFGE